MVLKFHQQSDSYFLISEDAEKAQKAGLTQSTKRKGPNGESVWYTADYQKNPVDNPYAALPFFSEAEGDAADRLRSLQDDYELSWATDSDTEYPCPEGLSFLPYQKAGIHYAVEKGNVLIGDEMGLGKTPQSIGVANAIGAKKVLVLCPASIRLNWRREIKKWSTIPRVKVDAVLKASAGVHPCAHYVVCSYDLARNLDIHEVLCETDWDLLIIDEAHYLKSSDAQRTRAVFGGGMKAPFKNRHISDKAGKIVALTGTPLPNRPRECYTISRGLCWDAIDWASYDDFCFRHNPSARVGSGGAVREEKGRLLELQARLRCNFMIRRLKKDVLKDLPDKRYEMSYVETNGKIQQVLQKERLLDFDPDEVSNPDFFLDGAISTVRREMGEAKVPRIVEHMKYLLDIAEVEKVVMFSHHRSVMDALHEALDKYGVAVVRGGMSAVAKQEEVDKFVNDPKCRIFSGQLDAASTGIDGLQKVASHVVLAEPAWNPGINEQAIDRCHRFGQHGNVIAQFLVVEGSLDEKVLSSVVGKAHTVHEALDLN